MSYCCYLIYNGQGRTYIGSTNNFKRRIRQHNNELVGGAKYTTANKTEEGWKPIIIIDGFEKITALSFEWRMKRKRNNKGKLKPAIGLNARIKNILEIFTEDQITSKSCKVSEIEKLIVNYSKEHCPQTEIDNFNTLSYSNIEFMEYQHSDS